MKINIFIAALLVSFLVLLSAGKPINGKTKPKAKRKVYTVTPTYDRTMQVFDSMAKKFPKHCKAVSRNGFTDSGKEFKIYVVSKDGSVTQSADPAKRKTVLFINNAIHPGEPDGVDASIELLHTLLNDTTKIPADLLLCIVPMFNIEGAMNRGCCSRANQNGPEEYGFRGSGTNLDLNRDFVKMDSRNTQALVSFLRDYKPDVFVDTHVSNGADYQYTMTLIETQRNKLHPLVSALMETKISPELYAGMRAKSWDMCPYVETKGRTPETGLVGFLETPRFSTGYTTLFNCMGFVTETHMWKPYNDRVWATYDLLLTFVDVVGKNGAAIRKAHAQANEQTKTQQAFTLNWDLDTTQFTTIDFKGFEATYKTSSISGQQRLFYDRSKPFTKKIPFYNTYVPTQTVTKPEAYLIPAAWMNKILPWLTINKVEYFRFEQDVLLPVEAYVIEKTNSPKNPYESHFLHSDTRVRKTTQQIQFYAGDGVILMDQEANRYLMEVLEPEGEDSFFAWNFFDGILNQKEWFSDYVFEEKAEQILVQRPEIKTELEAKKKADAAFATDHWAQLNFIYQRSEFKEPTHNRYPVFRLMQSINFSIR